MGALRSGSGGSGLRATWERQQLAAELAAAVGRWPAHARSKPAFLAAQLQPVLAALRLAKSGLDRAGGESSASPEEGKEEVAAGMAARLPDTTHSAAPCTLRLPVAAAHLRRLRDVDQHADANACLLLFLLLGLAANEEEQAGAATAAAGSSDSPSGLTLVQLCFAMGWQLLLVEAVPLLAPQQRRALECSLVAAAGDSFAAAADKQGPMQRLLVQLALRLRVQLEDSMPMPPHSGVDSGGSLARQQAALSTVELLQQLLLAYPSAAAAAAAAEAVQALQAAVGKCTAGLMRAMLVAEAQRKAQLQSVFQQLCQLRARLMLACASGDEGDAIPDIGLDGRCLRLQDAATSAEAPLPGGAWSRVLDMPTSVAAATAVGGGPGAGHPSRPQFLAACVAARCLLQASSSSSWTHRSNSAADRSGHRAAACAALPGVRFELPPVHPPPAPQHGPYDGGAAAGLAAAAAERAGVELAGDPGCLGPAQLAVATLRLASDCGPTGDAGSWPLLLDLAADAAAHVTHRSQQCQLLLLLLHGRQPWQARLRSLLAADAGLQAMHRRQLVAVANRLAAGVGSSGAAAVVHGEERRRRTQAAVRALVPHALLCPAAVLERLVREAVVLAGEQVELLLDVLREMQPLAAYCGPGPAARQPPLLLVLLSQLLTPGGDQPAAAVLDTPGSQRAFLQLVGGLCGLARGKGRTGTGGSAAAAWPPPPGSGGEEPLLCCEAVLQHVVAPAVRHLQQQQQRHGGTLGADLLLPLQLADMLLAGAEPAAARRQREQLGHLVSLLRGMLSLDGRRVDRSPASLAPGPGSQEVLELAASVLQRLGASAGDGVAAYLQQQLGLAPSSGQPPPQLQQLRQRVMAALTALLPCCTGEEARELLRAALPAAIQAALQPAAGPAAGPALPGAHAAAVEAVRRAVQALALHPGQAPIAGEQAGGAGGAPPSPLRQVAVERAVQHLVQHTAWLAAAAAPLGPAAARPPGLSAAEGQALALRAFRELCQLAAAVQPAGYDCATLQAGLLQLAHLLLRAAPQAAAAGHHQAAAVRDQLGVAAAALPPGSLRDCVLAAAQQGPFAA